MSIKNSFALIFSIALLFFYSLSLEASEDAPLLTFDLLQAINEGQEFSWELFEGKKVRMRGFWYGEALFEKKGILSPIPNAKSCCLQKESAQASWVLISGASLPPSSPLQVKLFEGVFHLAPSKSALEPQGFIFSLEEAQEVKEESLFTSASKLIFVFLMMGVGGIAGLLYLQRRNIKKTAG